ncbi:uncharacterized protein LOC135474708 [Liolophura sinensis]|uniref:uncharacterized protein LOC135474708 n=1 Tax=Liolophura sinensis TaxID=3198878 RepID=UPI00315855CD
MQGHDAVIDLLVSTYKADPNIRDYTGKKAKHYLRTSASNKAQQLLLSRRQTQPPITTSISESFLRTASFRKSRSKALSSLMGSQLGPMIRKSWEGDGDGDVFDSRITPPNSSKTSPQVRRKGSLQLAGDRSLMPPPSGPVRRKKSRSRSRESNPEGSQFARTGSDPNLRSQAAKSAIL